jgi:hypothetical protein
LVENQLAVSATSPNLESMGQRFRGHKRRPSAHQKQIRFLTFSFGAIMIVVVVALLWLFNRPPGGTQ